MPLGRPPADRQLERYHPRSVSYSVHRLAAQNDALSSVRFPFAHDGRLYRCGKGGDGARAGCRRVVERDATSAWLSFSRVSSSMLSHTAYHHMLWWVHLGSLVADLVPWMVPAPNCWSRGSSQSMLPLPPHTGRVCSWVRCWEHGGRCSKFMNRSTPFFCCGMVLVCPTNVVCHPQCLNVRLADVRAKIRANPRAT